MMIFSNHGTEVNHVAYRDPDMAGYLRAIGTSFILQRVGFSLPLRKPTSTFRDWFHSRSSLFPHHRKQQPQVCTIVSIP